MISIGADYHPGFQQIAFVDTDTGEFQERRLEHREEAERFYRDLGGQGLRVRVGMEASGHARWFERLLSELQFELWIGDAAEIRTKRVRKQKTDRQDAQLILQLLLEGRFRQIWVPNWENRDLRQLLWHRHRMVQARTRIMNQLQAVALNEGLRCKKRLWRDAGREQLESFRLAPWASRRDLLELLDGLNPTIAELTQAIEQEVEKCPEAQRLQTHPGVGALTALAFVLIIGRADRFPCGKQIASYLGLVPLEESSGQRRRLGHITKQGNSLLRFLLVEAAQVTVRSDRSCTAGKMFCSFEFALDERFVDTTFAVTSANSFLPGFYLLSHRLKVSREVRQSLIVASLCPLTSWHYRSIFGRQLGEHKNEALIALLSEGASAHRLSQKSGSNVCAAWIALVRVRCFTFPTGRPTQSRFRRTHGLKEVPSVAASTKPLRKSAHLCAPDGASSPSSDTIFRIGAKHRPLSLISLRLYLFVSVSLVGLFTAGRRGSSL